MPLHHPPTMPFQRARTLPETRSLPPVRTPQRRLAWRAALACLAALAVVAPGPAAAEHASDRDAYVLGYVISVLEREFAIGAADVAVEDGVVYLRAPQLGDDEKTRISEVLVALENVDEVLFDDGDGAHDKRESAEDGVEEDTEDENAARHWRRTVETGASATEEVKPKGIRIFPVIDLFDSLTADPRWPHFAASLVSYRDDPELGEVTAVSLGESIPLIAGDGWYDTRWEFAIQAAVHSIFDLESDSFDLLNSDFLAGFAVTGRRGPTSVLVRLMHQSSHLGDELLLRQAIDRVNLSFEEVSALIAQDLWKGSRIYFGTGYLVHSDPSDLDPWSLQVGLEIDSPWTFLEGALVPIAAVDIQSREETDWDIDSSLRAGLELRSSRFRSLRAQLLVEYYEGHSPNGQFYDRSIEYIGGGVHLFF